MDTLTAEAFLYLPVWIVKAVIGSGYFFESSFSCGYKKKVRPCNTESKAMKAKTVSSDNKKNETYNS